MQWISKTVIERVATEIDNVCLALIRHGLSDSQPGYVGLHRLRKLAQAPFLVSAIPTLPTLVPFLELSNNQEYLIKRIKILAKGGSMSEFKWNGGGPHNGKEWDSSLPTDSVVNSFKSYKITFRQIIKINTIYTFIIFLDNYALSFDIHGYAIRSSFRST